MSRIRGVADIIKSFNEGYSETGKAMQNIQLGRLNREKETEHEQFTEDQSKQLADFANAKDEQGNAKYKIDIAPDSTEYLVTDARGSEVAKLSPMAKRGIYLGKEYDTPVTEDQKNSALNQARAGILERFGNFDEAYKLRTQAKQNKLSDLQIKGAERAEKNANEEDAYKTGLRNLYNESRAGKVYAWNQTAQSEYNKAQKAWEESGRQGIAPVAPAQQEANFSDLLADKVDYIGFQQAHGKATPDDLLSLQTTLKKAKDENLLEVMQYAQSGGQPTPEAVAEIFSKTGKQIQAKDVKVTPTQSVDPSGKTKFTSYDISWTDPQTGKTTTMNSFSTIAALGKAEGVLNNVYQGETLDLRKKSTSSELATDVLRRQVLSNDIAKGGIELKDAKTESGLKEKIRTARESGNEAEAQRLEGVLNSGGKKEGKVSFNIGDIIKATGKPGETNPITGEVTYIRNPEEERRFATFAQKGGYTNSDEAIRAWMAGGKDLVLSAPAEGTVLYKGSQKYKVVNGEAVPIK